MDSGRSFLEERYAEAFGAFMTHLTDLTTYLEKTYSAYQDAELWQNSLMRYTRDQPHPYHPTDDLVALFREQFVTSWRTMADQRLFNVGDVGGGVKKVSSASLESRVTKSSAVRDVMREDGGRMDIDAILRRLPANLPFEVTRDDLWRILPRLAKRGELTKLGYGVYQIAENVQEDEGLFQTT